MRASSNSSQGDKTRRSSRTAPRRHADPNERPLSATYDSNEFPVLLRMPDLEEQSTERDPAAAKTELRLDLQPPPIQSPSPSGGRRQRTKHREPTGKQSTTAGASKLFWGTLAPKLAVGGMLLSVTALCVVVLQGPGPDKPTDTTETKWAVDEAPAQAANDSTSTAAAFDQPLPSEPAVAGPETPRHAVASKPPEPIRSTAPTFSGTPAARGPDVGPIGALPADAGGMSAQWPVSNSRSFERPSQQSQSPTPAAPYQAQGWPDDVEASASSQPTDAQLELNAASRSARRQNSPWMNPSSNRSTPVAAPAVTEPAEGARLNGTVEIPKNPPADYRL
jgi:hypothetical protein